jgi:hypothetical protein
MITISRQIGATRLTTSCAPAQKQQAESVLSTFEQLAAKAPLLAGTRIRFGWSLLTLRDAENGTLAVCEPDFSRDPFREIRPDLTVTLDVLARQTAFARQVGVTPVEVGFEQFVVVEQRAVTAAAAHLLRVESHASDDSGWSLSFSENLDEARDEDFESVRVYQLLDLRPAVLPALILPPGLIVLMDGDRIESVLDSGGRDLLSPHA